MVNVIHAAGAEVCLTVIYCWHPAVVSHILTLTATQQKNDYALAFISVDSYYEDIKYDGHLVAVPKK